MGYYINPRNESKENFLEREGERITSKIEWEDMSKFKLPVCLVDNGYFTAAAIGYSKEEWEVFSKNPNDLRPKSFWIVPIDKLLRVSDLKEENIRR